MSILNKDLMGELHDMVGNELNFLTYVKKNNITTATKITILSLFIYNNGTNDVTKSICKFV